MSVCLVYISIICVLLHSEDKKSKDYNQGYDSTDKVVFIKR